MSRDEESRYWRKLFYAAKDEAEIRKFRETVWVLACICSVLVNLFFLFR